MYYFFTLIEYPASAIYLIICSNAMQDKTWQFTNFCKTDLSNFYVAKVSYMDRKFVGCSKCNIYSLYNVQN